VTDRIAEPWGIRTPFDADTIWPVRADEYLAGDLTDEDVDAWVQSACVLCSNGCALDIAVKDGRIAGVRGRAIDRVNHGRLGPKGLFGWQANNAPDSCLEAALFQARRGPRREAGRRGRDAVPRTNDRRRRALGCIELPSAHQRRAEGGSNFDDRGELRSCTSRTIWDWFIGLS
jgi:hypothetical protein